MAFRDPYRSGPPGWLIVLIAGLVVVGGYFIWSGVRDYMASGFQGVVEATAVAQDTATAQAPPTREINITPPPTWTPVPACQDFRVIVPEAIIRECASTTCPIVDVRRQNEVVCVLRVDYEAEDWYIVNLNPGGYILDLAYMHQDIIRAMNPTLTPTNTSTPLPTVTPRPSDTPLPTPPPSATPDAAQPPTITPTFTPSATPPLLMG